MQWSPLLRHTEAHPEEMPGLQKPLLADMEAANGAQVPVLLDDGAKLDDRTQELKDLEEAEEMEFDTYVEIREDIAKAADDIDRMTRLNSDLANERTLLAWMRTSLAAVRTTFAFLSLTAVTQTSRDAEFFCEVAMAAVIAMSLIAGTTRYNQIKQAISAANSGDKPKTFRRMSVHWVTGLMSFGVMILLPAIIGRSWTK